MTPLSGSTNTAPLTTRLGAPEWPSLPHVWLLLLRNVFILAQACYETHSMSSCRIFLKIINFPSIIKLITVRTRFKRRSRRCVSICQEKSICQNHYYPWRSKFRTSRRLRSKNMRKFRKTLSKRLLRWNNFSPKYSKFYNPGVFFLFSRTK